MIGQVALHIAAFVSVTSSSINCLGDSITHGVSLTYPNGEDGGYRSQLNTLLEAGNYITHQVGALSDGPAGAVDHDGHNGVGIGDTGQAPNDGLSYGLTAMAAYEPNFCLVMLGTNDMLQPWSTAVMRASMATRMGDLLDDLHAASADTHFIVATIPPIDPAQYTVHAVDGQTPTETERTNYNTALSTVVSARSSWASLVDPAATMTLSDISDQVHPNAAGYVKIATAFYNGLTPLLTAQLAIPTVFAMHGQVSHAPMLGQVSVSRMGGSVRVN